jgi:hypothetical protein
MFIPAMLFEPAEAECDEAEAAVAVLVAEHPAPSRPIAAIATAPATARRPALRGRAAVASLRINSNIGSTPPGGRSTICRSRW